MKISRDDLTAIFLELGFKTAGQWNKTKTRRKLKDIAEMGVDGEVEVEDDERLNEIFQVIVANKGDVEITLDGETELDDSIDDNESSPPEDVENEIDNELDDEEDELEPSEEEFDPNSSTAVPPRALGENKKESSELSDAESELGKAQALVYDAKQKVKDAKRAETARKKELAKKKNGKGTPGPEIQGELKDVRSLLNRFFYAGVVLKKRGLGPGLTDELVAEVDKLSGKVSKSTKAQLGSAWHIINGFLNG